MARVEEEDLSKVSGYVSTRGFRLAASTWRPLGARLDRVAPFLQRVSIEFDVHAADAHYHVPLLLSPYACTSYRGS